MVLPMAAIFFSVVFSAVVEIVVVVVVVVVVGGQILAPQESICFMELAVIVVTVAVLSLLSVLFQMLHW
jgi:hypothetical protein